MSITEVNKIFAKNIRLRRKQLGISQEKLGEMSGLHRTYIGGIEQFLRNPSIESMEKIANALKVDVSLLTNNNFEEIINSDYSVCYIKNGNYKFKFLQANDIPTKYLKLLDKICK